ncbi:MAG TPA: aspartate racemase [Bacteroidales bacterium]|nr:aspartate racemase [Bacteroidales bacterium]
MKTIGILGGLTWHSSWEYYRIINEVIAKKCGGRNSANIVLISINFEEFYQLQANYKIAEINSLVENNLAKLADAGADFVIISSNTAHKYLRTEALTLPFLHIAHAAATYVLQQNITRIGLLGTSITCSETFFISHLEKENLTVLTPAETKLSNLNAVIFDELAAGIISKGAMELMLELFIEFKANGAQAVLLACTELIMIAKKLELPLPYFDTAEIHAVAAANYAIEAL